MIIIGLLIVAAAFTGYAIFAHYQSTPIGDSVPTRVWASVVAAVAALASAVGAWLHSVTSP